MPAKRVRINLDLPPELDDFYRARAAELKISRNALITLVLAAARDGKGLAIEAGTDVLAPQKD